MVMISQINFSSAQPPKVLPKNRTQSVYFGQANDSFETSEKKEKHFWQEHPYATALVTAGVIGLTAILTKGHLWGKAAAKALEKPPLSDAEKIKLEELANPYREEAYNYTEADILKAEKAINKAIEIYPEKGLYHIDKGHFLGKMGKPQEALKEYEKAMQLDPKEPMGFYYAANLLQEENPQKAYDYLKKAMAINSEKEDFRNLDHKLRNNLGIEDMPEHPHKKIHFLNKQIEQNPNNPQLYFEAAQEYEKIGDPEGAVRKYIKLTELLPDKPEAYRRVSILRKSYKHFDEALAYCNKAIELAPDDSVGYFNKARLIIDMKGNKNEALKTINKAIKLKPDDKDYESLRADILKAMKK